jgi:hypothetical protein
MRTLAVLLFLALPGCGEADEPAVRGPTLTPQPIGYPDIEANGLYGASCAYAPGTSMAPIVIAFPEEAVMKIGGQIHRFRIDAESGAAGTGQNSRYLAGNLVLLLTVEGDATQRENLAGTVRVLDDAGAEISATAGTVQCGVSRLG